MSNLNSNSEESASSSLNLSEQDKKNRRLYRIIGFSLIAVQVIICCIFLYMFINLDMFPMKHIIIVTAFIVLLTGFSIYNQFTRYHIIGKVIAVLLGIIAIFGCIYISKTQSVLDTVTDESATKKDYVSVIVLNDDPAQSMDDTKDYVFSYNSIIDKANSEAIVEKINTQLATDIHSITYSDWDTLINALYDEDVNAIILNEAYRSTLEEEFSDFSDRTRVLYSYEIESNLTSSTNTSRTDVTTEPFTVYIAGNDEYGDQLSEIGRNDVNIIATFNPKTKQMLLVTTPRDYYIPVDSLTSGVAVDKLTHAGNFGVDSSMATLGRLYDTNIDYYIKVNFTGTMNIIDALGGITIDSKVAFTTSYDTSPIQYTFDVGKNECDGAKALAFCRERQTFAIGDNQRGLNQMIAIEAIMNKATSPSILTNYVNVLDSVSGFFATSMPQDTILSLIKDMLNDYSKWNVQSYNVTGEVGTGNSSFFQLKNMSVIMPDETSINTAKDLIDKIENGDVFDVDEYIGNTETESGTEAETTTQSSTKSGSSTQSSTSSSKKN